MSSITIRATFALATPMNDSAPVWSVITPTLIGPADDGPRPSWLQEALCPSSVVLGVSVDSDGEASIWPGCPGGIGRMPYVA
jgi:hypothetical protein